jgi:hypothetical protein
VASDSLPSNATRGLDGLARLVVVQHSSSSISIEYALHVERYDQDQSGFAPSQIEPFPGGYFSPRLFVNQTPRLSYQEKTDREEFELAGGPSFQEVQTLNSPAVFQVGGELRASYLYHFSKHFSGRLAPGFDLIPKIYDHFYADLSLDYAF